MTTPEIIWGVFTIVAVALQVVKIKKKKHTLIWEAVPMTVGASILIWVARIFG